MDLVVVLIRLSQLLFAQEQALKPFAPAQFKFGVHFNGIERAGVHTSITVRNTKLTQRPVQLSRADDVFVFLFQI